MIAWLRAGRALWRAGLLRLSPWHALAIARAAQRTGLSLALLAEAAAIRRPDALAVRDDDGDLSFAELAAGMNAVAGWLVRDHGVGAGQQVAVAAQNGRAFWLAILGAARTGADVLLLNPQHPPAVQEQILAGRRPALVIAGPGVAIAAAVALPSPLPSQPLPLPSCRRAGRLAILTSGTTGLAKRIARQPRIADLLPPLTGLLDALPLQMGRPLVLATPLFHGYGLAAMAVGLALCAPLVVAERSDVGPLLRRAPAAMPPILLAIPTLLRRWMAADSGDVALAAVVTGSAPLDPPLCRAVLQRIGPRLFNLYGTSEAGVIALATPPMLQRAPGSVGKPLHGNQLRLVGVKDDIGRVCAKSPFAVGADAGGWLDTGDLGRIDAEGWLHLHGRADAMLVCGGENVYPALTEAALLDHPAVADAACAGVPDADLGHRLQAFVVVRPTQTATSDELMTWCRSRLPRYQVPRGVALCAELPRNALGKPDWLALARRAALTPENA